MRPMYAGVIPEGVIEETRSCQYEENVGYQHRDEAGRGRGGRWYSKDDGTRRDAFRVGRAGNQARRDKAIAQMQSHYVEALAKLVKGSSETSTPDARCIISAFSRTASGQGRVAACQGVRRGQVPQKFCVTCGDRRDRDGRGVWTRSHESYRERIPGGTRWKRHAHASTARQGFSTMRDIEENAWPQYHMR